MLTRLARSKGPKVAEPIPIVPLSTHAEGTDVYGRRALSSWSVDREGPKLTPEER